MNIDSISNGIVLDHISAGKGMTVYHYLHLDELSCCVAIIKNVRSTKLGKKDIIKIDGDFVLDMNILGYIDPGITINVIQNGQIIGKRKVEMPERLVNVLKCKNPRCITSTEREIDQVFKLIDRARGTYCCLYCESRGE